MDAPGQAPLGPLHGCEEPCNRMCRLGLLGQLEYLKPVLGYGDAHALEELMVEVDDVLFLKLVVREEE